jgi:uncharacterized protein (TIGR02301 family)
MIRQLLFIAMLAALTAPAVAQSGQRSGDLRSLSRIFGELHHIRRTCEPEREADVWRNRMRRLVELEEPGAELRAAMVEAFNGGFREMEAQFPYCDRDARDRAAAAAQQGEEITQRLVAPLYDALADQGPAPTAPGVTFSTAPVDTQPQN